MTQHSTRQPRINIFAALSKRNSAIGFKNKLLWKIKGDLPRFKRLTAGHPLIMGRKTFKSIGRALPNRTNIVVTRDRTFKAPGCEILHSLTDAVKRARELDTEEIFIIGGGELYKQALPFSDRLYLTLVDDTTEGDVFFPEYSAFKKEIEREEHPEHNPPFTYLILEK